MNTDTGGVIVLAMVLGWLLIGATGSAVAASTAEQESIDHVGVDVDSPGDIDDTVPVVAQNGAAQGDSDDTDTSNRHQNPDEYSERGDLEGLESRVTEWLLEQLREGAIELDDGEYDAASDRVGEKYDERLEQYVQIASETEGEHSGAAFEAAGAEQSRLTAALREYETTSAEYEAALDDGDQALAHDLARDLDSLAGEIDNVSELLSEHYAAIEEGTGADLSAANATIETVSEDVQSGQREVRESQFVDTELTIDTGTETDTDSEPISFRDPLEASGHLRTVDGEPVAHETIRFEIGPTNETVRTETAADGSFDLTYRPTTAPLSTTALAVRYVPVHGSPYLESETTVDVTVSQVEPTVTILEHPDEGSFGDEATVSGMLTVGDVPVDGVSLVVTLTGQQLETVAVSNGSFEGTVAVPVSVADGDRPLRVSLRPENQTQALGATSTAESVTVLETESEMAMWASQVDNETVQVEGWLATASGAGVAEQPVEIRLENVTAGTVTTGPEGLFETTVTVPDSVADGERIETGEELQVQAIYTGTDANLESARVEMAALASDDGADSDIGSRVESLSQPLPIWAWIGVGLLGTTAVVVGVRRYRDPGKDDDPSMPEFGGRSATSGEHERTGGESQPPSPEASPTSSHSHASSPSPSPEDTRARLEDAGTHLANGDADTAVERCYTAVRRDLAAQIGAESGRTHWEFYQRYRESPVSSLEELHTLRTITDGYERAVFDRQGNTTTEAERVLESARDLCGLEGEFEFEFESEYEGTFEERTSDRSRNV